MSRNTNGLAAAVDQLSDDVLIKGGYDSEMMKKKMAKADEEEDEGEEDEEEDDEEMEMSKKSLPNEDDLIKSLDALAATASAVESGVSLRQTQLAARAAAGDALSKSERSELAQYLTGEDNTVDVLGKSYADDFASDPAVAQGMEISDFLEAQTSILAKSLDDIHADVRSSAREQEAFNAILAKSVSNLGRVVAAMAKENADLRSLVKGGVDARPMPAKGRTSRVGQSFGEAMAKSETSIPASSPVNDNVILDTLETLIKSTEATGSYGIVNGVDLSHELVKFEATGIISGPALQIVAEKAGFNPSQLGG